MPRLASFLSYAVACFLLLAILSARAEEPSDLPPEKAPDNDRVMVEVGPYVYHRVDNTDHNQWPRLIGLEYETGAHWLVGGVYFKNSYYQNSAYVYAGKRWFMDFIDDDLYVKLSAGLVYGYKEPYEGKLPVNHNGFGLGIAPVLGYQFGKANAQLVFLGIAAVVITFGYDFCC